MIDLSFYFKDKYRIPSTRLKNWDYSSAGWYYVTICVKNMDCVLGKIIEGKMVLSDTGKIVDNYWRQIPRHFNNVDLNEYQIMPNHLHGIVVIKNNIVVETHHDASLQKHKTNRGEKRPLLSIIIGRFKMQSSKQIRIIKANFFWQPRFFDHIIRSERTLQIIREYIRGNPLKWDIDENNPKNLKKC
jgi:REP element-mobilizing transposase RayT